MVSTRIANFADTIRSLTGGRGPDVIFDTTGMMFAESVELAAMDGRIPIITAPPDGKVSVNLRTIYRHTLRVLGVDTRKMDAVECAKLLAEMNPSFVSGIFTAIAGRAFPLASAIEAYEQAGHGGARILLRPDL